MAKDGKARVLSNKQFVSLLDNIEQNRHPEKNALIMQISFKLGLRVQEISLLRIQEVVDLDPQYPNGFKIKDILILPKSFTKGARATAAKRSSTEPQRHSIRFSLETFDNVVNQIIKQTKAGLEVNPKEFYPEMKKRGGMTRELPLADKALRLAISRYLQYRLVKNPNTKPSHPLIVSQKGGPYSPNTLQEHMALMLRQWTGVERASSHSGRRGLATKLIHEQGEHLKTVQQVLGHKDASTVVIYHELPEDELGKVLKKAGDSYDDE